MMSGNKIALVLPYYGKLPPYFNFFLRSLDGKNLDVLFFSDLEVEKHPDNFKVRKLAFAEFKGLIARKIGVEPRIDGLRRICDFKPMYGKIFEDYLKGYDYWAFGDCDLLYGNVFNDVLDKVLASGADVFSMEEKFCCGPLCFVKNTSADNELFKRARGWVGAVKSDCKRNIGFDEIGGDWFGDLRRGSITLEECVASASSFSEVAMLSSDIAFRFSQSMEQCDLAHGEVVAFCPNGDLLLDGSPVVVYHFVGPKLRKYFTFANRGFDEAIDALIDDAGFYVTDFQKRFRRVINAARKFKAAIRSLRNNGLARLSPNWQKGV